jgi:hypothetical protein
VVRISERTIIGEWHRWWLVDAIVTELIRVDHCKVVLLAEWGRNKKFLVDEHLVG